MVSVTSIYDKFQTVIPAEIRNEFNLDKSYKIEWRINDDGKVELEFIKELSLDEMVGRYTASQPIDSVPKPGSQLSPPLFCRKQPDGTVPDRRTAFGPETALYDIQPGHRRLHHTGTSGLNGYLHI